jgi:rhodanese-related sulfurtransferase
MRVFPAFTLALGLAGGLAAYGVSPSQYGNGRSQDSGAAPQQYGQPMPQPIPGNAVFPGSQGGPQGGPAGAPLMPGQAQPFAPGPLAAHNSAPPDYDSMPVPDWAKGWKHYHWEEALALWQGKKALFCDARAKSEYDQGHIPGAIPLPMAEFDKYYALYKDKLRKAKYIVTYCHGVNCQMSNKVAQHLVEDKDKQFKNVGSFFGGWPMWQEHNMPIETGGEPQPR